MKKKSDSYKISGFTIVETLLSLLCVSLLMGIAVPDCLDYFKRTNGLSCSNNIKNIQAAKDAWIKEYPETPIIPQESDLVLFLKMPIPTCPHGGNYLHMLDCNQVTTCSFNGTPNYEPNNATPLEENGFHDMAIPK